MRRNPRAGLIAVAVVAAAGIAVPASSSSQARSGGATASALIAYSEGAGPTSVPRLRLLNVDTGAHRPLAAKRFAHNASWSPDGARLVFEDYGGQGRQGPQLAVVTLRTGSIHTITRSQALDESPAWSPNGRRIAFSRAPLAGSDDGLWLMRAHGGGERHLTYNRLGDSCASWSPDGKRIAFSRYRNRSGGRDLWLMRSDGRSPHRLVARAACAAWSPDGTRLAISKLTGGRAVGCGCPVTDLYLARGNGAEPRLLIRRGGDPTWSPDGSRIVFVRYEGRRSHLWLISSDGSGLRRLTGGNRSQRAPAWRP